MDCSTPGFLVYHQLPEFAQTHVGVNFKIRQVWVLTGDFRLLIACHISENIFMLSSFLKGLPRLLSGKESSCQCRRHKLDPWSRKIPHAVEQHSSWPQLLSLCSRAREPQLLKPVCLEPVLCKRRSHCNETPPFTATREKPEQQQRSSTANNK